MNNLSRRYNPSDETRQRCRRSLAVLFAIPIGLNLFLAIFLLNIRLSVLSREYLIGFPERLKIYERLPTIVIDLMFEGEIERSRSPELVKEVEDIFGRETLEHFAEALIPPAWLEEQAGYNVDVFFDWLEGKTTLPTLRIDMGQLGENAVSESVRNVMRELLDQLPACEADEILYRGDFPRCQPPNTELEFYIDDVLMGLRENFLEAPLLDESFSTLHPEDVRIIQATYKVFIWGSWCTWLAAFLLILIVVVLAGTSLDEMLLWSGGLFFVVGGICIFILILSYVIIPFRINQLFAEASPDPFTPAHVITFIESLFVGFVRDIFGRWLLIDGTITVFGALGLSFGVILRRLRGL